MAELSKEEQVVETALIELHNELSAEEAADLKVLKSRLEAYQATCHKQGSKLTRIETLLMCGSIEATSGAKMTGLSIGHVSFKQGSILGEIAEVLKEKGTHR